MTKKHRELPRLMIVSSGGEHLSHQGLAIQQAEALARSVPVIIQLREKGLEAGPLFSLCGRLASMIKSTGSMLMVNERFDIALASGAHGVHLPESSCPPDIVRKAAPGLIAGRSVHSRATAVKAEKSGIDYLLFGPVFPTPSKEAFGPPQGLDLLEEVCRSVSIPVFAVGGITPDRTFACIEKGAYGIAALGPFIDAGALPKMVNRFQSFISS
jgi:thiamine-phosphate pyrophosphorylase